MLQFAKLNDSDFFTQEEVNKVRKEKPWKQIRLFQTAFFSVFDSGLAVKTQHRLCTQKETYDRKKREHDK